MLDMNHSNTIRFGAVASEGSDLLRAIGRISLMCLVVLTYTSAPTHTGEATSQTQVKPQRIIPLPHPLTSLLRAEQVHRELALSAGQIGELEKAAEQVDLPFWRLRDLPAKQRNEAAAPLIHQLTNGLSHMDYPVAINNESLCWDSWANRIWPSIYLVDRNGFVRYWWYGELNWQGAENERLVRSRIEELMDEEY